MNRLHATSLRLCAAGVASLIFISGGHARTLDVTAAVALAQKENNDLAAAKLLIREMEARASHAGRLTNPELETEIAGGQDFEGRISLGLTQRFPLTSRLRFERELSAHAIESAKLEVRLREWQLGVATRVAFYQLAAARDALALARSQRNVAANFAKSLEENATEGFGTKLDSQQAALAAEMLRTIEEILLAGEIEAAARLNGLLGLPADSAISLDESFTLPQQVPAPRSLGQRSDLAVAELALRSGATDIMLAHATRWDDIGVGVFIEGERSTDEPAGVENEGRVGMRFSIPLPVWQNSSGRISEREVALERSSQQLAALKFAAQNEAITTHRMMTARHRAAALAQNQLVPAARQQIADAEAAYERAELDLQNLFLARERLAEIESAALDARKAYFISYADWLGAIGEPVHHP